MELPRDFRSADHQPAAFQR